MFILQIEYTLNLDGELSMPLKRSNVGIMGFNFLSWILEQPPRADLSAPTDVRIILLNYISSTLYRSGRRYNK
jgi:hypothetical protein